MESGEDHINVTRKRLIYRARHRGTKEMDLLMGRFADTHVPNMSTEDLARFEALLEESDPVLYDWICGHAAPAPERKDSVLSAFLAFVDKIHECK